MTIMDIYPEDNFFQKIVDGWVDFKRDLDNYGNREINQTRHDLT